MRLIALMIFLAFSFSLPAAAVEVTIDGKNVQVPVCGGFADLKCGDTEWCDYPEQTTCGIADHFGVCRQRPDFCPESVFPVCGCDGETYGNACKAAMAGSDVAHLGACQSMAK